MTETDSTRARLVGINHVVLEVGDIDTAIEFYGEIFAFDLRGRSESSAFIDMGDQFLALSLVTEAQDEHRDEDETELETDTHRHFGLVVDDADTVEQRLETLDIDRLSTGGLEFHDPWGNRIQIVEYGEIQFTKADHVLEGMELGDLEKTESALDELAEKGLAPE